jgi:hypothetical protein
MQKIKWLIFILCSFYLPMAYADDFSGVYDCKGLDFHEGEYTGVVTMQLEKNHSNDNYQSYIFTLEVPGFGIYKGFAAAQGMTAGIYFALDDKANQDYGVGIAKFYKNKVGKMAFNKFYYEPNYKGGNTGTEDCTIR